MFLNELKKNADDFYLFFLNETIIQYFEKACLEASKNGNYEIEINYSYERESIRRELNDMAAASNPDDIFTLSNTYSEERKRKLADVLKENVRLFLSFGSEVGIRKIALNVSKEKIDKIPIFARDSIIQCIGKGIEVKYPGIKAILLVDKSKLKLSWA